MTAELNIDKFEDFIAQYPIFEYRILNTGDLSVEERVRIVCQQECERYNTTWACPPAVGTLDECVRRIHSYDKAVFFSSVAEVSDIMNMKELLSTRKAHEDLTSTLGEFLKEEGYDIFILSTESCDICAECEGRRRIRACRRRERRGNRRGQTCQSRGRRTRGRSPARGRRGS